MIISDRCSISMYATANGGVLLQYRCDRETSEVVLSVDSAEKLVDEIEAVIELVKGPPQVHATHASNPASANCSAKSKAEMKAVRRGLLETTAVSPAVSAAVSIGPKTESLVSGAEKAALKAAKRAESMGLEPEPKPVITALERCAAIEAAGGRELTRPKSEETVEETGKKIKLELAKVMGRNVRRLCLNAELQQFELGGMLNLSSGAVSAWECGTVLIPTKYLMELPSLFNCELKDITDVKVQ